LQVPVLDQFYRRVGVAEDELLLRNSLQQLVDLCRLLDLGIAAAVASGVDDDQHRDRRDGQEHGPGSHLQ